jgi:iron(III) transport system substrate-binding protein
VFGAYAMLHDKGESTPMHAIMHLSSAALFGIVTSIATPALAQSDAPRDPEKVWTYLNALPASERQAVLEREAAKEGRAVVYGALGIDRANLFIEPFQKKYPNVKIDFVRLSESDLADKLLLENRTHRINSDSAIASIPWLELIKPALAPYQPTTWGAFDPRLRLGGSDAGWTAMSYEVLPSAIAWRTDRIPSAEAPKTLDAVADQKWKGRTGTTTQLESMLQGLILAYGEAEANDKLEKLATLSNRTYTSIAALSDALAQGEIDIAWNMGAHRPSQLKAKGAPVDFVLQDPTFGQGITLSATKGGERPYAAALFIEFATRADMLERVDKAEPGRFFGNTQGRYALDLSKYPNLVLFPALDRNRFRELKQRTDRLFIRQAR